MTQNMWIVPSAGYSLYLAKGSLTLVSCSYTSVLVMRNEDKGKPQRLNLTYSI